MRASFPGGASGDPHFKTWTGTKFDYHGECDLVLVNHPSYDNGKGLRLHIRTTRSGYWSYIEQIALQIGSDVLEFQNDVDNFVINGKEVTTNASTMGNTKNTLTFGGLEVRLFKNAISVRLDNEAKSKIDFISRTVGFPTVIVDAGSNDAILEGSVGLLGEWGSGKMLGRDGETDYTGSSDYTEYALEWQVRDTEPMIFTSARYPQYPTECVPPKKMLGTRLGMSHLKQEAEKACESWKEDKDECIFDVMATRNIGSAEAFTEEIE